MLPNITENLPVSGGFIATGFVLNQGFLYNKGKTCQTVSGNLSLKFFDLFQLPGAGNNIQTTTPGPAGGHLNVCV